MVNDLRQTLVTERESIVAKIDSLHQKHQEKIVPLHSRITLLDQMIAMHDQAHGATPTTQPPAAQVFTKSSPTVTAPAPAAPQIPVPVDAVPTAPVPVATAPATPTVAAPATPAVSAGAQSSLLGQPEDSAGKKKLFGGKKKAEPAPAAPAATPAAQVPAAAAPSTVAAPAPGSADFL